jgi:hypothetical protein
VNQTHEIMIGITKKLQNILTHLIENRQVGTTTLIKKIAAENDVYVLVHRLEMRNDFDPAVRKNIVTPETLHKLKGKPGKPILVDNGLLHGLLVDALLEIGTKEEIIAHRNHVLSTIQDVIQIGGKINPHTGQKMKVMDPNYQMTL